LERLDEESCFIFSCFIFSCFIIFGGIVKICFDILLVLIEFDEEVLDVVCDDTFCLCVGLELSGGGTNVYCSDLWDFCGDCWDFSGGDVLGFGSTNEYCGDC